MGPAAFLGLCLLGCLVLPPSLPGARATRCPRGWLSFQGHCYGFFGQQLSWRRAERQGWLWADGSPRRYWAWEGDDGPKGPPCIALEDSAGFMAWEGEACGERKPFVCKYPA
ncbi:PREDICTED: dromaiocalcin-1-like [Pseudopodoces humilis]|uniref:dromaiocalcin-1-like n=1 Tax=Pseudopodoces humilis TaxID=181119 RepID=UPI0006B7574D|nr:PREDICTED: dromaiocalcin-1-like [Pseudopodoces humilis]